MKRGIYGALLIACALCACTKPAEKKVVEPKTELVKYLLGDAVRAGDAEVVVTEISGVRDWPNAPKSSSAIIVKWTIRNVGKTPIKAASLPVMRLVDGSGVYYNSDADLTTAARMQVPTNRKAVSDLNPGLTVNDVTVFEVFTPYFDAKTWFMAPSDRLRIGFCNKDIVKPDGCPAWDLQGSK